MRDREGERVNAELRKRRIWVEKNAFSVSGAVQGGGATVSRVVNDCRGDLTRFNIMIPVNVLNCHLQCFHIKEADMMNCCCPTTQPALY